MSDGLVILLGKTDIINSFHKQVRCYPRKAQDENVYIQYDINNVNVCLKKLNGRKYMKMLECLALGGRILNDSYFHVTISLLFSP